MTIDVLTLRTRKKNIEVRWGEICISIICAFVGTKRLRIVVRFLVGAGNFSLLQYVQTGSRTHPDSHRVSIRESFLGSKQSGCADEHSLPSCPEFENMWSYTTIPTCTFMACTGTTLTLQSSTESIFRMGNKYVQ